MRDQGVSVRLAGARAEPVCREWLADRGWSRGAGGDADTSFERVCVVFRSDTGAALYAIGNRGSLREAEGVGYVERCTQRGWAVRQPESSAACGSGGRRWEEATTSGAARVYRCAPFSG
jgi:hypothetical protein